MYEQMSLLDTPSFTFSPALADGPLPPALPDGQTTAKSSPAPARASRSRLRAKAPELLMRGTYGPTFSESSVPAGPLSSWESRLRQRLAKVGSSECDLTWKVSGTTAEGLLSRLVPSTPRTVEIDSGLLLEADYWRAPQAAVTEPRSTVVKFSGRSPSDPQVGLPDQVMATAGHWSTPTVRDANSVAKCTRGAGSMAKGNQLIEPLVVQVFNAAMWPSPTLPSGGQTWPEGTTLEGMRPDGKKSQVTLNNVVTGLWPTATAQDGSRGLGTVRPTDTGIPLPQRIGLVLDGLSATTGKRGVLNPAFPCWLMGYPIVWVFCGASAMQSLPRSRRK